MHVRSLFARAASCRRFCLVGHILVLVWPRREGPKPAARRATPGGLRARAGRAAELPELRARLNEKTDSGSYVILRAARAARLGARAGRLSRVVKVLRFLRPQADEGGADQVQVAKVISSKLQDALSTRVAFLTICVAVVLPIFKMFEYPEMDDSLQAWVQMISSDVDAYMTTSTTASMQALMSELDRFASFYEGSPYGPFDVCYGKEGIAQSFTCKKSVLPLPFTSAFHAPVRTRGPPSWRWSTATSRSSTTCRPSPRWRRP
ncbi:unnamed protein product [Prorocentrum cordatum]|uniref:Uncharacterized protein n=1 Tax=Prorocentrum cordatum TaxID=2364126 RepID=A0ABN9RR86_9DINO|nr:unnamed protein product [Polarella glacialis]